MNRFFQAWILILGSAAAIWAADCGEHQEYYQSFPDRIGEPDIIAKKAHALPCDTMIVRKGVRAIVHAGSLVYFKNPSINNIIRVEGSLTIEGLKSSFVTLAGSLDTGRSSPEAGKQPWGGIEVAEGGELNLKNVGFIKAPTPITAFSQNVNVYNCYFQGSTGIILPDGTLYTLSPKWHTVDTLYLDPRKKTAGQASPAREIFLKDKGTGTGFWTTAKTAGAFALVAVAGTGWYIYSRENDPAVGPGNGNSELGNPGDLIAPLPAE